MSIVQTTKLMGFYSFKEISTGMCVYNFVSPNVNLFSPQVCKFVWTPLCLCSEYIVKFVF